MFDPQYSPGLQLVGPPRDVPLLVQGRLLFGGFLSQFGWIFFGFGMIFFWAFALNADLTGWYTFGGRLQTASGVVTGSDETSFSVGGSDDSPGTPVYVNRYRFTVGDAAYDGASYATGRRLHKGTQVALEFPPGDPAHSRIRGMRSSVLGPWPVLVVIFPAVGLILAACGIRRGLKAIRLLKRGKQGTGKLVSKKPTSTRINGRVVYKLTFEFTGDDEHTHEVTAKTHHPERLEDDAEEPLLYDPYNPAHATMLDHLPGSPRIDEMGQIQTAGAAGSLLILILPAVSILGHGAYAIWRFSS